MYDLAKPKIDADGEEIRKYNSEFAYYTQRFILSPERFNDYKPSLKLSWQEYCFSEDTLEKLPDQPGLYAFAVRSKNVLLPSHSYILYLGKTKRPIKRRYKEYLDNYIKGTPKNRPHIWHSIDKWKDCLYFYFTPILKDDSAITEMEKITLDAIVPPISKQGFSPNVQKAKSTW